jgi:hypothetical protein
MAAIIPLEPLATVTGAAMPVEAVAGGVMREVLASPVTWNAQVALAVKPSI